MTVYDRWRQGIIEEVPRNCNAEYVRHWRKMSILLAQKENYLKHDLCSIQSTFYRSVVEYVEKFTMMNFANSKLALTANSWIK